MKNKWFATFMLICLLAMSSGTALAQGPLPPKTIEGTVQFTKASFAGSQPVDRKTSDANPIKVEISSIASNLSTTKITNGDFEQGLTGWTEYSFQGWAVISDWGSPVIHSGTWSAWLAGDHNETSSITQSNITIENPAYLRLWYWVDSEDACGFDTGTISVNSNIIHTWDLCSANNTNGWVLLTLDLSAYSGQTVTLVISATTDGSGFSNLYIDDVFLYKTFDDLSTSYWAWQFIERLYGAGVTGGCVLSPLQYCPEATVTRAQMAIFLLKGAYGSSYKPPAVGSSTGFGDVATGYWAAAWIKQLVAEGITSGCGNGNYCPEAPVTRAQMAVFLLKSKNIGSTYNPPSVGASTGFGDVDTNYWAAAWIKELVAESITSGCGSGNYCPDTPVTRAQMAIFLVKTFSLP